MQQRTAADGLHVHVDLAIDSVVRWWTKRWWCVVHRWTTRRWCVVHWYWCACGLPSGYLFMCSKLLTFSLCSNGVCVFDCVEGQPTHPGVTKLHDYGLPTCTAAGSLVKTTGLDVWHSHWNYVWSQLTLLAKGFCSFTWHYCCGGAKTSSILHLSITGLVT